MHQNQRAHLTFPDQPGGNRRFSECCGRTQEAIIMGRNARHGVFLVRAKLTLKVRLNRGTFAAFVPQFDFDLMFCQ